MRPVPAAMQLVQKAAVASAAEAIGGDDELGCVVLVFSRDDENRHAMWVSSVVGLDTRCVPNLLLEVVRAWDSARFDRVTPS